MIDLWQNKTLCQVFSDIIRGKVFQLLQYSQSSVTTWDRAVYRSALFQLTFSCTSVPSRRKVKTRRRLFPFAQRWMKCPSSPWVCDIWGVERSITLVFLGWSAKLHRNDQVDSLHLRSTTLRSSDGLQWQKSLYRSHSAGAPNGNFRGNICSEDDLRTRIFGTLVVKFLACLPLLGFSKIYKMV